MSATEYYDHTTFPSTGAAGSSSAMRAELDLIEAGFGKLPDLSGNGGEIVAVNSGATALEAITTTGTGSGVRATSPTLTTPTLNSPTLVTPALGVATATSINKVAVTAPATSATLALADGSTLATSGANSLTLTTTGATNVTLPTSGTLATVAELDTLRDGKGFTNPVQLASAATTDIGGQDSLFVEITGTTTITSFSTNYNGPRFLRFTGALTLTHNATTVNLPGAANILTAAGDTCIAYPNSSSNGWNIAAFQRASAPAFSAHQNTLQSVSTGTNTKVQLQAEEYDPAGAFDAVTNYRFQPAVAGIYSLKGSVSLAGSPSTNLAMIFKNGAEDKRGVTFGVAGSGQTSVVAADILLNGTSDYVELYVFHATGGSLNTIASISQTFFQGHLARHT